MRKTLHIDDDVYQAARSLARAEGKSVGEIISRLVRRGLAPRPRSRRKGSFPVFTISPTARPLTSEMVRRALDSGA